MLYSSSYSVLALLSHSLIMLLSALRLFLVALSMLFCVNVTLPQCYFVFPFALLAFHGQCFVALCHVLMLQGEGGGKYHTCEHLFKIVTSILGVITYSSSLNRGPVRFLSVSIRIQ